MAVDPVTGVVAAGRQGQVCSGQGAAEVRIIFGSQLKVWQAGRIAVGKTTKCGAFLA